VTTRTRDYGFLLAPRWIVGHIVALVAVIVFVNMGLWQIRRLHERQEFNEIVTTRGSAASQPLSDVLGLFGPDQDDLELRRVVATGTYNASEEVILLARSYNGVSGHHMLTPLELGDGSAVIVDRGWVPIDLNTPGQVESAPPAGSVHVNGVLRKTETRGSFGPVDPPQGTLDQMARVDVTRLDRQTTSTLVPVYIQLTEQTPVQPAGLPQIVPLPEPTEGPHRGYAIQWFLFTAVVVVGYPILLRRTAEDDGSETPPVQ